MACNKEQENKKPPRPKDCTFDECTREIIQSADVSLPVEIEPDATVGRIQAGCCGDPIVVCTHDHCSDTCKILITQRLSVKIPVTFSVMTCVDDPIIECCTGNPCCK